MFSFYYQYAIVSFAMRFLRFHLIFHVVYFQHIHLHVHVCTFKLHGLPHCMTTLITYTVYFSRSFLNNYYFLEKLQLPNIVCTRTCAVYAVHVQKAYLDRVFF